MHRHCTLQYASVGCLWIIRCSIFSRYMSFGCFCLPSMLDTLMRLPRNSWPVIIYCLRFPSWQILSSFFFTWSFVFSWGCQGVTVMVGVSKKISYRLFFIVDTLVLQSPDLKYGAWWGFQKLVRFSNCSTEYSDGLSWLEQCSKFLHSTKTVKCILFAYGVMFLANLCHCHVHVWYWRHLMS